MSVAVVCLFLFLGVRCDFRIFHSWLSLAFSVIDGTLALVALSAGSAPSVLQCEVPSRKHVLPAGLRGTWTVLDSVGQCVGNILFGTARRGSRLQRAAVLREAATGGLPEGYRR